MKSHLAALALVALAAPSIALAQQPPVYGPPAPGTSLSPSSPSLPPDVARRAFAYAEQLANTRLDEPQKKFERKDFYDMEKFTAWAEGVRGQRELAQYLAEAMKTDDAKRHFGERKAADLQKKLEEVVKNRDAHLTAMQGGWSDELKAREADRKFRATQPSIGLPSRPGPPQKIMNPALMISEGIIPSPYGDAIGVGSMMKGAPRWVGVLDAINTGYSAGGWMGNEVIIKAQMAENYKRQREYEARVKDWDKNVKPLWEENRRREAVERQRAAEQQFRLYIALYGMPKGIHPATGTFSGGYGYGGSLYTPTTGGTGIPGYVPRASGAGMLRD